MGNRDPRAIALNVLEQPVFARHVRLLPLSWHESPALRCEIYSFHHGRAAGLAGKALPDFALTASSGTTPSLARLCDPEGCWTPIEEDSAPFLEIDLLAPQWVTGVITQGSPTKAAWVRAYSLLFSLDQAEWSSYTRDGEVWHLVGNQDAENVQLNVLQPAAFARYVRICPMSWELEPALRAELLVRAAGEPIGLESGDFAADALSASSAQDGGPVGCVCLPCRWAAVPCVCLSALGPPPAPCAAVLSPSHPHPAAWARRYRRG